MQKRHALAADVRTVTGKKVKTLRRQGILPIHLYGAGIEPKSLQLDLKTFQTVYKEAGNTGLIDLTEEGTSHPVLVGSVQYDYLTHTPIHVDLLQVNLREKITAMVPVVITGEAQAVAENIGILMQVTNELEVEALPTDLPEKFEIDVTNLAAVDEQVLVENLKVPEGVTILAEPTLTLVKIAELVAPEPEPEATETPEGEEGTAEGETPAEGEEGAGDAAESASEE